MGGIAKGITGAIGGVGKALGGAAGTVANFAPDFAMNYVATGGNPYAAAGMTLGNEFGGNFGRQIGQIAASSYNPATGAFTTPGFNPASNATLLDYYSSRGFTSGGPEGMIDTDESQLMPTDSGLNIPSVLKAGGAAVLGNELLKSINEPYNPYANYKPPSLQTEFQPVAVRTNLTATDYVPGTPTSPALLTGSMSPNLQALQALGVQGAQQLYPGYIQQAMSSRPEDVVLDEDITRRQQEIYGQGLDVLRPEMTAQQIAARDRSFGTGRLGFNLSGEAMRP